MLASKAYLHYTALSLLAFATLVTAQQSSANNHDSLWEMSLEELGSIKVSTLASGTATPLDKAAAIATVITAEDIEAMGATDISQVLETVPNLYSNTSDPIFTTNYKIRGITSSHNPQTLVLINGIPITNLFLGNRPAVWAGMPVKAIERIEIIRGPGSALYGADAFAGVINISTKNYHSMKNQVGAGIGSFNTYMAWAQQKHQINDIKLSFSLEAQRTDGWRGIIDIDRQSQFDKQFNTHASLAPRSSSNMKKMLDLRMAAHTEQSQFNMGYQGRFDVGTGAGIARTLDSHGRFASHRYNIDYRYHPTLNSKQLDIEGRVSYGYATQDVKRDILLFPSGAFKGAFPQGVITIPELKEENARIDVASLYKGIKNHYLRVGTGFYWGDIFEVKSSNNFYLNMSPRPTGLTDISDTPEAYSPEKQRTSYYVFAQDEWKFNPDWQLTTGLRYDSFSDFGTTLNPRLALVWATTPNITTKLLYGKAFRAPSIAELFSTNNPVAFGNPLLKPETIDTYELAVSHQLSNALQYNANIFCYRYQDGITFVPINTTNNQAQNNGQRTGYGAEYELNYQAFDNLFLTANYSYQTATDKNTQTPVAEAPNYQAYARVDWRFSPHWRLSPQVNYIGKQRRTVGDTRPPVDGYTTLDISLHKQHFFKTLSLAVSAHNLFNANIREANYLPAYIPHDIPLAKRNVMAEINYSF